MSGRAVGRPADSAKRRRNVCVALLLAALVVIPAAVAWACNPQAHISLDRTSYAPGQTITVYGSYFPNGAQITVSGPGGSKVVTAGGGSFVTTFTAPGSGNFTVTASRPTGGYASAAGTVAQPQPQPAQPAPPPADDGPTGGSQRNPSLDTPGVVRSEREPSTTGGRGGGGGGGGGDTAGGTSGGGGPGTGGVQTVAGQPVFVGSAAPATTAGTFAATPAGDEGTRSAARDRSAGAAPSEQTASGDVWSGFAPGRTASLTSGADGMSDGGTGSGLGIGIALLALALLGLAGGLTAAEVRRRRTA